MKNVLTGVLCTMVAIVVGKKAHEAGYRKGVRDCNKLVEFGMSIVKEYSKQEEN